ncbi:MAG: hypothetical protein WBP56_03595, partial [Polyangia bacterium]
GSLQSEVVGVESGHDGLSFRAALHGPSGQATAGEAGWARKRSSAVVTTAKARWTLIPRAVN